MIKKKIIFDCDPGIDDAFALMMAFAAHELDIAAVTVVGGNQVLEETLNNAIGLLSLLKVQAPVAAGAPGPMLKTLVTAPEVHGEQGLAGKLLPASFEPSRLSAVELMKQVLIQSEQPVTIVATGPLTNIAALFTAYPGLKEKIDCVSLMGGACFGGNQSPATEFNIFVDPEAAAVVFRSGVPIVMHGLDVTTRAFLTTEDIGRVRALGGRISDFTADLLDFYLTFHRRIGLEVVNMHDPCAVAWLLNPGLFVTKSCHVEVETKGEITAGCTVVDYNAISGLPANAKVAFDIDRPAFVEMFLSFIKSWG